MQSRLDALKRHQAKDRRLAGAAAGCAGEGLWGRALNRLDPRTGAINAKLISISRKLLQLQASIYDSIECFRQKNTFALPFGELY
jgi:hypothetical protein